MRRIHCLAWDSRTGLHWAELLSRLRTAGKPMQIKDSFVAATALAYRFPLATRNGQDFAASGVEIVDPFAASS